jgi:hypothetical protein
MAQNQCGHEGCTCLVDAGAEYCSDHCREHVASGPTGEPCGCGHPACQGTAAAEAPD